MGKLVTIKQLSALLGVTERRLEVDVKDGLPVSSVGSRGVRLFDPAIATAWRRANRRQVYGEGRSRGLGDAAARAQRLLTTPNVASAAPPGRATRGDPAGVVDLAAINPSQILAMVMAGTLDQSHARAYISAISAMERGLEFRERTKAVVEVDELVAAIRRVLQDARSVLEGKVDTMVAAVASVVTLTDAQRHAVHDAAERAMHDTIDALAAMAKITEG